jgi:hypothetical protein
MSDENEALSRIANQVIDDIWDDPRRLCLPFYRLDIKSEAQANLMGGLPLIYIWNEVVEKGTLKSFSFSVNGEIVGSFLEKRLSRSEPSFGFVRDRVMELKAFSVEVIHSACAKARRRPSELYPSDARKPVDAETEMAVSDQLSHPQLRGFNDSIRSRRCSPVSDVIAKSSRIIAARVAVLNVARPFI